MSHTVIHQIHGTTWAVSASEWTAYGYAEGAAEEIANALRRYPAHLIQQIHAEYTAAQYAGDLPILPAFIHDLCRQARSRQLAIWHSTPRGAHTLDIAPR